MSQQWTTIRLYFALICLAFALIATACAPDATDVASTAGAADTAETAAGGSCADQPYEVNPDAAQDIIESPTGFLRCAAGDYALCYYSGADPLPCTIGESGESADCQCQVYTASKDQPMYVLMTSILNLCAFAEAVEQCGEDGSACYNICNDHPHSPQCSEVTLPENQQQAAVCDYISDGTFNPGATYISTFSLATVTAPNTTEAFNIGCNDTTGQYAGCMTAPCNDEETDDQGNRYVTCACPLWPADGSPVDYQFGRLCDQTPSGNCTLAEGQVWSAAYNPDGCPSPLPGVSSGS